MISPVRQLIDEGVFDKKILDSPKTARLTTSSSSIGEDLEDSDVEEDFEELDLPETIVDGEDSKIKKVKRGVRVFLRVRPSLKYELEKGGEKCVVVQEDMKSVEIEVKQKKHVFAFDKVFDTFVDQESVFETVCRPVVSDVLNGYNSSVLCYGQTSSGKTYTMLGPGFEFKREKKENNSNNITHKNILEKEKKVFVNKPEEWGLIPRLMKEIFKRIENSDSTIEFLVIASFVEVYMEKVRDLITPSKNNLKIMGSKDSNLFVTNATEIPVSTFEQVIGVLKRGLKNRFVAETKCNTDSSRSHAIFILTVYKRDHYEKITKQSQLYCVDLAGSEMVSKTQAENMRLEEAKKINSSLLSLREVISALTAKKQKGKKRRFVPYRNSKLTRILQNSFGGNSISNLVMNVSENDYNYKETLSTLRFGVLSKGIKNKPKENKRRTAAELEDLLESSQKKVMEQKNLIEQLQTQINLLRKRVGKGSTNGEDSKGIGLNEFHSFFICPIEKKIMREPYTAFDGITYEKKAILRFLNDKRNKMMSPITGKKIISKTLIPNITIRTQIQYFEKLHPNIYDNIDFSEYQDENYIPDDIIFTIFLFLTPEKVVKFGKVSLQWYKIACSQIIWKRIYTNNFGETEKLPVGCVDWKEAFFKKEKNKLGERAPWNPRKEINREGITLIKNNN